MVGKNGDAEVIPLHSEEEDPRIGSVVGLYRLEEHLGAGGMGSVYRASHTVHGGLYALKILTHFGPQSLNRFQREVDVLTQLEHKGIVRLIDFGVTSGFVYFLVMEHATGPTLGRQVAEESNFPVGKVAEIARQIADALVAMHFKSYVHRDLKPDNIVCAVGSAGIVVKILDLGLVGNIDDGNPTEDKLTKPGLIVGTPAYMAPEQIMNESITDRVDIYSFGVILYLLLKGELPYSAQNNIDLFHKKYNKDPIPLDTTGPVETMVMKMLSRRPEDRPSAVEVRDTMNQFIGTTERVPVGMRTKFQMAPVRHKPKGIFELSMGWYWLTFCFMVLVAIVTYYLLP
jgi:eukaryotic-like serine/threonine-protein kinase